MTKPVPNVAVKMWLPEPLPVDVSVSLERIASADDVRHVAVMPDVHLAGEVCNGTVVATKELIYPLAVGGDIGCGMLAVSFDLPSNTLREERLAGQILAGLYQRLPSIKHPSTRAAPLPARIAEATLSHPRLEKMKQRDGRLQLGTLGRGNHFVEFQSDSGGRLWLMLHSGSRGMGQAITGHHLALTTTSRTGLEYLDASTSTGQAYLSDLNWAIEYAIENRLAMARAIESLMQDHFATSVDWTTLIHCHHNHVKRESHGGNEYWIHRKGALRAQDQELGAIPGSMGTHSFHVTGRGLPDALCSSSHGAGRRLTRHEAMRRLSRGDLQRQMRGVWFDQRRVDQLRDESPAAYKDIDRVMRAQRDLTRIVRRLQPVLVYKGT